MRAFATILALTVFCFAMPLSPAQAAPAIGQVAPDFSGTDTTGHTQRLQDYRGKIVVLEWTNHECPYVKKHYDSGNMQSLQKEATEQDVIWLSIVSSAEGKQGYTTPEEGNAVIETAGSFATARILDPDGIIGQEYGAKTTPHMFVIDPDGRLAYSGAIDNRPSPDAKSLAGAANYVREAINALQTGEHIQTPQSNPYGCPVKY